MLRLFSRPGRGSGFAGQKRNISERVALGVWAMSRLSQASDFGVIVRAVLGSVAWPWFSIVHRGSDSTSPPTRHVATCARRTVARFMARSLSEDLLAAHSMIAMALGST